MTAAGLRRGLWTGVKVAAALAVTAGLLWFVLSTLMAYSFGPGRYHR